MRWVRPVAMLSPLGIWSISVGFVVLLVGLTAFQLHAGYVRTIDVAGANLASTARITEEQVRGSLRVVRLILKAMADAPKDDPGAFRAFMDARSKAVPEIRQAILVNQDAVITVSTLREIEGWAVGHRQYFTGARDLEPGRDFFVTKPLPIGVDKSMIAFASMPMRAPDGSLRGVVAVSLEPAFFLRFLATLHTGEDGAGALLLTPEGDIIGRDPDPHLFVGKNIAKGGAFAHHKASQAASSILTHVTATDGKWKLSAVRTLVDPNLPPLVVIVGRPLDGVLAPWRAEALINSLVVAALALAVFVLTALLRSRLVALRASEEKLRGMFELAPLGLALNTMDGGFLEANDAFLAIVGHDLESLRKLSYWELTPRRYQDEEARQLGALREIGRYGPYEKHYIHKDGHEIPVRLRGVRITGADGRGYIWSIVEDITEERATRQALAERTTELTRSNADLEQFAYAASHDLREPLRMVNSFLGLLKRRHGAELGAEASEYIAFACEGATRMDQLVQDLLDYSRVGRSNRPQQVVPLTQAVKVACDSLVAAIREAGAVIEVPPQSLEVRGNHPEIVRLFQNLIANAVKYRRPDIPPSIRLEWAAEDGMIHGRVADNGIGIDPQYHDRIFQLFQRLHGRGEYEGTGIGLALCRRIIESHGGRLWVESAMGHGAVFHFTLPRAA